MKFIGKWSINNRVTVNLIMIFVIAAGVITVLNMRREMFPQFALDMINIQVDYPGASPEEVEEGICIKIEESLQGIEGISRVFSTSDEGSGSVTVELETGTDVQKALNDIETEVDRIDTFPDEAEDPVITEIINRNPVITLAVYGNVSEKLLHATAENIRDDLMDSGLVTMADLVGVRDYEISVEVSEQSLRRYGLTFDDVIRAVKSGSVDLPGGVVKTSHGEILIRSKGQLYRGEEYRQLPLITLEDGTTIRLGQVAEVFDGFEDIDLQSRFNYKPAAMVQINRTSREDVIKISDFVKQYVETHRQRIPDGIELALWFDLSEMVRDRIDLLLRNGFQGIALVFIVLALFLNLGLAFWVSAGIPLSFMGAFLILDAGGETINMISLFGFIMTLGILVDDAIIVGENIYSHFDRGKSSAQAVVDGLAEVGGPVILAVSTTIVAFIPLSFISGIMGKFIGVMPRAVIAILLVSLAEALVILPAHLEHALVRIHPSRSVGRLKTLHQRVRQTIDRMLNRCIDLYYDRAIRFVIRNRYQTMAAGIGILIVSFGIVIGGYAPFVFFPKGESNWVIAEVTYPLGTPFDITRSTIEFIEGRAYDLNRMETEGVRSMKNGDDRYQGQPAQGLVVNVFSLVGAIPQRDWKPGEYGGHVGQVWMELVPSEQRRQLSANMVMNRWRDQVGEIPGVDRLSFYTIQGGPAGSPIEIQLAGDDFHQLKQASDEVKRTLSTYPGTYDIADDFKPGKRERRARVKDGAKALGISMNDLARQLRQAYYGEEALHIQRGRNEVAVRVRYSDVDRQRISSIEDMRIRTADGRQIPIQEVADIMTGTAYSPIHRVDRKRVITVSCDLDEQTANARNIVADLKAGFMPDLIKRYPDMSYDLEGQEKRSRESLDSLKRGFSLALMGIFLLLAAQFRSYVQPVIIMLAIPFGLIGAVIGHLMLGLSVTIISVFGIVALSGIVVNDSLILIDFINREVREGMDAETAVVQSGKTRFRPVLLTSVTTIAGLFPLLLETSFQAQFLIPMAVSICFGLLASTVLTLLYVPALYLIVEDVVGTVVRREL